MNKKHKIRLAWWIITREAVVTMAGIILVSLISALVTVIDPAESRTISIQSVQNVSGINQIIIGPEYEPQRVSTMQLMITKKEVGKGDYVRKAELKELKRKKKEAEIKRRKGQRKLKEKAWLENFNNSKDKHILEHLCNGEAGDQSDECQQAVLWVVLNRVRDKNFPNTVEGVVFAHRQYACTWDGNYDRKPSERVKKNVQAVLSGKSCIDVPKNVVYQAQFTQGSGLWRNIGTETFCFK